MSVKKVLRHALVSLPELETLIKEVKAVVKVKEVVSSHRRSNSAASLCPGES